MKKLRNKIISLIAISFVIVLGIIVYQIFFSNENLVIRHLTVETTKLKPNHQITIGVFSDVKYGKFMNKERFEKFIHQINEQSSDVIVFLGDVLNDNIEFKEHQVELSELFSKIKAKKGKFYVLGDKDDPETMHQFLFSTNFENIENTTNKLYIQDQFIQLTGLNTKYNEKAFEKASEDAFSLVISHYPKYATQVPPFVDFIVAGHTLGNQINIPLFSSLKEVENSNGYTSGKYNIDAKKDLYVNNGLGTVNNDIRFFAPPEFTLITIKGK